MIQTSRLRKLLRYLALAFLLLGGLVAVTGWLLLGGSRPLLDGELQLAGLQQPVSVTRDAQGLIRMQAGNRLDLARATGFIHAQERFFQMDLQRRMAAGELAALFGPAALELDENHRRHRFRARGLAHLAALTTEEQALLEAYAQGVNAGLEALAVRPWEYLLLRQQPEPWQPVDSLLTLDAIFLDLADGNNQRELEHARLYASLPEALVDFLLAPDGRHEAPLHGEPASRPILPGPEQMDLRQRTAEPETDPDRDLATSLPPLRHAGLQQPGSNSFAVAGTLTGGPALIANDMHLGLGLPNIWLRMQLVHDHANGQAIQLDGLTLPGLPALVAGSNGHIAWGFTNSYGDWMDWVRLELDEDRADDQPARYRTAQGWKTLQQHEERIRVAGQADTILLVEESQWGPVLTQDMDGTPLALAWTAHHARAHNLNFLRMEEATTTADGLGIAATLGMPPLDILIADAQGQIGWTMTGNAIPKRGNHNPRQPADWSQPGSGWLGWLDASEFPRLEKPPTGRLWTANNRIVSDDWLTLVGDGGYAHGARAQQIRDGLFARRHFSPAGLLAIQLDDRALFMSYWQKLLSTTLTGTEDPELIELAQLIANWSGRAAIDSVDYRLVRIFWLKTKELIAQPFVDRLREDDPNFQLSELSEAAVALLVEEQPAWLLDPTWEDWPALLTEAAHRTARELADRPGRLADRRWGERNRARIAHPMARILPWPLNRRLQMPPDELPGDTYMPRIQAPSFGASERFVIAPGQEERSFLHVPGGNGSHPRSPWFGTGHQDWVHGRPSPLLPGPALHELHLLPDGALP